MATDVGTFTNLFPVGKVGASQEALQCMKLTHVRLRDLIASHVSGDWGYLPFHMEALNFGAVPHRGLEITSVFPVNYQGMVQAFIVTTSPARDRTTVRLGKQESAKA